VADVRHLYLPKRRWTRQGWHGQPFTNMYWSGLERVRVWPMGRGAVAPRCGDASIPLAVKVVHCGSTTASLRSQCSGTRHSSAKCCVMKVYLLTLVDWGQPHERYIASTDVKHPRSRYLARMILSCGTEMVLFRSYLLMQVCFSCALEIRYSYGVDIMLYILVALFRASDSFICQFGTLTSKPYSMCSALHIEGTGDLMPHLIVRQSRLKLLA
jgi:hypothetical protein